MRGIGRKPWQKKLMNLSEVNLFSLVLQSFHALSTTTLSLLLPLSFLLLARISTAPTNNKTSYISFLFLYTNPTLLHALVSIITLSSLIHTLTGRVSVETEQPVQPKLLTAWILLCSMQVCVGLGIECSIELGIGSGIPNKRPLSKALFFIGVHETMMYWCRSVVKPIVDDTVYGGPVAERLVVRAAMTAGYGGLWWLRLREEAEGLVGVVEVQDWGVGHFVGWWLYYVVVTIGSSRLLKGVLWVGMSMFFNNTSTAIVDHYSLVGDEDHV